LPTLLYKAKHHLRMGYSEVGHHLYYGRSLCASLRKWRSASKRWSKHNGKEEVVDGGELRAPPAVVGNLCRHDAAGG